MLRSVTALLSQENYSRNNTEEHGDEQLKEGKSYLYAEYIFHICRHDAKYIPYSLLLFRNAQVKIKIKTLCYQLHQCV